MGGSIPSNCSFWPSPPLFPDFLLQAVSSCGFAHITQHNNNDYTSSPAMLNQQEKVVFFHFTEGGRVLRPKEGQVFPVPLSKVEFSGGDLESQEA